MASRVPRVEQRARFMSAQSAVQHGASALGAMLASLVLTGLPDGSLVGMDRVPGARSCSRCLVPIGAFVLERRVHAREVLPTLTGSMRATSTTPLTLESARITFLSCVRSLH